MSKSVFEKVNVFRKEGSNIRSFVFLAFVSVILITFIVLGVYWYKFDRFPWQKEVAEEVETEFLSIDRAVNSITEEKGSQATASMSVEVFEDVGGDGLVQEVSVLGNVESLDLQSRTMVIVLMSEDVSLGGQKIQIDISDDTEIYLRDLTSSVGVSVVPGGYVTDGKTEISSLEEDDKVSIGVLSQGDFVMIDITISEGGQKHVDKIEIIRQ